MINFKQASDVELLKNYEQRDLLANTDTLNLLEEISRRWAEQQEKRKQLPLKIGDVIWYADFDSMQIEPGAIFMTAYINEQLHSFSAKFDNGDSDDFNGDALNKSVFKTEDEAIWAIQNRNSIPI